MKSHAIVIAVAASWATANAATLRVDPSGAGDYRSIAQALPQLHSGDTLLLADGVYREAIDLRRAPLRGGAITRIQAAAGTRPTVKGSDVVGNWQRVGANLYAKRDWSVNSQQVFVNGTALRQIGGTILGDYPLNPKHAMANLHRSQGGIWPGRIAGGREALGDESFFYDAADRTLYIQTAADPKRMVVEVSTRPYLVIGTEVEALEIRGLQFEHANTSAVSQSGAISLIGNRLLLERVHVRHVDGAGIDLTGNDVAVRNSSANYCGSVGLKVRGQRARLFDNETNFNNTRGFNKWWEAGGAKFVGAGGLQNSELARHRAVGNQGDGIWFDWHNDNNRVVGNSVAYNTGMGIHYEASSRAQIIDNVVFGNGQRGIYLPNSAQSVIARNVVLANKLDGIAIVDERQAAQKGPPALIPLGNKVFANTLGWNGGAALILPPSADNRSDSNVFVGDKAPTLSLGWPSRERPLTQGLERWRQLSAQDGASVWRQLALPAPIAQRLERQQPLNGAERDWHKLLAAIGPLPAQRPSWVNSTLAELPAPETEPQPL
jgi:parallel beta-helix repeat protein